MPELSLPLASNDALEVTSINGGEVAFGGEQQTYTWVNDYYFSGPKSVYRFDRSGSAIEGFSFSSGLFRAGIDSDGSIWGAHQYSIYQLDQNGSIVNTIQGFGGNFDTPGVAVGESDSIYSLESQTGGSLYKMDRSGSIISSISPDIDLYSLAIDSQGSLWGATSNNYLRKTNETGGYITGFSLLYRTSSDITIDSLGSIWATHGYSDGGVTRYVDNSGRIYEEISTDTVIGLDLDSEGSIWHTEYKVNDSIYKRDNTGSVLEAFAGGGKSRGLGIDSDDSLWIVGEGQSNIYKTDDTTSTIKTISAPQYDSHGLGVDTDDCIWTTDTYEGVLYRINTSGSIITSHTGGFDNATGVGTHNNNSLWIATGSYIQVFDTENYYPYIRDVSRQTPIGSYAFIFRPPYDSGNLQDPAPVDSPSEFPSVWWATESSIWKLSPNPKDVESQFYVPNEYSWGIAGEKE